MVSRKRGKAPSVSNQLTFMTPMTRRRTALSLAVAAALPGASHMAAAADGDVIEEIVTIGIRSSILDSTQSKRESDTIADVVDAGVLGTLPDVSIADALGRVPGVTTIRDSGQSSQLNIRGMNGDFIQTTLNGREQASTAGFSEGTRWMSFDQYPSELINQAAVYKTPKASQIEGGVAGLVDLKTANPLNTSKQHNIVLNGRLSLNDAADSYGADDSGSRISGSYQGKFLDDTLGLAVGAAYLDQPNTFVFSRAGADSQLGYGSRDVDGDGTDESMPRAFQWQSGNGSDERTGIMASVVFAPNDKIKAQVDYFRSEFDRGDRRQGITVGGLDSGAQALVSDATISGGLVTGATISADNPALGDQGHPWFESRTEDQTTSATSDSYGLNVEWYISDSSTLAFDIASSKGDKTREDRIATMHAYEFDTQGPGTFQEVPGQSLTYTLNGQGLATGQFSGVDFADANQMRLSRYERYPHEYTDDIDSFKVDFKQDVEWGAISSFETGVRISPLRPPAAPSRPQRLRRAAGVPRLRRAPPRLRRAPPRHGGRRPRSPGGRRPPAPGAGPLPGDGRPGLRRPRDQPAGGRRRRPGLTIDARDPSDGTRPPTGLAEDGRKAPGAVDDTVRLFRGVLGGPARLFPRLVGTDIFTDEPAAALDVGDPVPVAVGLGPRRPRATRQELGRRPNGRRRPGGHLRRGRSDEGPRTYGEGRGHHPTRQSRPVGVAHLCLFRSHPSGRGGQDRLPLHAPVRHAPDDRMRP
jgi:hypothetical protein